MIILVEYRVIVDYKKKDGTYRFVCEDFNDLLTAQAWTLKQFKKYKTNEATIIQTERKIVTSDFLKQVEKLQEEQKNAAKQKRVKNIR